MDYLVPILEDPVFAKELDAAEARIEETAQQDIPDLFRGIPLDVFAILCLERPARWPRLRTWLPGLPAKEVQVAYVGTHGIEAMLRASDFVKDTVANFSDITGKDIRSARVMDYGVGWGRMLRLFYKFVPTEQTYGVDAVPASLALAKEAGLRSHLVLSMQTPRPEPVVDEPIDLIWAFSVFTHLSETAADAILAAIWSTLGPAGVAVITVRPRQTCVRHFPKLLEDFDQTGFAFSPAANQSHYGDAAMSVDFFRHRWPHWRIDRIAWDHSSHLQIKLFLTKG